MEAGRQPEPVAGQPERAASRIVAGRSDCVTPSDPRQHPNRILVRLPNWVGDVVMATPALAALRAAWPRAQIVAEGRPFLAGLVAGLPSLDGFLPDGGQAAGGTWSRSRRLAAARFDWAVLLPDSARVAVGPFLARIPRRVGYARDLARRMLLTQALQPPRQDGQRLPIAMVERYLAITRALGCPDPLDPRTRLVVDSEAARRVDAMLERFELGPDAPFAVLNPGAHFGSSKLYPPESFAVAADGLHAELGLAIVLAPAPAEVSLARRIAELMTAPAIVLGDPPTTLAELVALTARARLVVSNDTGPRHVAVALGRPVVVLMGPTDPRHTDYQLDRQRVLREDVDCSPCHLKTCPIDHRCMTRLSPDRVLAAARELLAAGAAD